MWFQRLCAHRSEEDEIEAEPCASRPRNRQMAQVGWIKASPEKRNATSIPQFGNHGLMVML